MIARSLAAFWIAFAATCCSALAGERCEKKCFEAQTCPIVGSTCLKFNWCRDVCATEGTPGLGAEKAPSDKKDAPVGPLPGPKTEI
jgi:hypothetical protein